MLNFLASNWLWIVLIGAMLSMHLRHGRGGHMGMGCGGGHAHSQDATDASHHPVEDSTPTKGGPR